jgi:hypothetical protein
METEEEILARQIELSQPAKAKKLAATLISEKQRQEANVIPTTNANTPPLQQQTTPLNTTENNTKAKEIWKPTKVRNTSPTKEPDRSCWLYIYNNNTRDIQNRRYKGDRE